MKQEHTVIQNCVLVSEDVFEVLQKGQIRFQNCV